MYTLTFSFPQPKAKLCRSLGTFLDNNKGKIKQLELRTLYITHHDQVIFTMKGSIFSQDISVFFADFIKKKIVKIHIN